MIIIPIIGGPLDGVVIPHRSIDDICTCRLAMSMKTGTSHKYHLTSQRGRITKIRVRDIGLPMAYVSERHNYTGQMILDASERADIDEGGFDEIEI